MAVFSVRQSLGGWVDLSQGLRALRPESAAFSILDLIRPLLQAPPLDLVSLATDDNGLLKNPKWAYQVANPGQLPDPPQLCPDLSFGPGCTTQSPSYDYPHGFNAAVCNQEGGPIHGHVNWMGATYEGLLFWDSHSASYADDDYNFNLYRADQAGLTIGHTTR
jgi:hypothetical protein